MRKYDKKNKRNLLIVAIIGIILLVIFSLFVKKVIETSKVEYKVAADSVLLDKDKNQLKLEEDGVLKIKWNKEYYLLYQDKQIEIGKNAIIYNPTTGEIKLYGKFFEVNESEDVNVINDELVIKTSIFSKFYKISDRKYLVVDKSIKSEDGLLDTSNYLIVELDKAGNATLENNQVDYKTFTPTRIVTSSYVFDIANELLIFGEKKIDLKKIIGTTNQYTKVNEVTNGGSGGSGTGSGTSGNVSSGSGTGSTNYNTGNNSTNANTGITTNEGGVNTSDKEIINATKRTSVIKVTPEVTTITVDYVIYDPNNEYTSVYMELKDMNTSNVTLIYLSKQNNSYIITDLSPSSTYTLTFKKTYAENGETKTEIFDEVTAKTYTPSVAIAVSKTTRNTIYYYITVSQNYTIDSANVSLYSDGVLVVTNVLTNLFDTVSSTFDISGYTLGNVITIKIDSYVYGGKQISSNSKYSYRR